VSIADYKFAVAKGDWEYAIRKHLAGTFHPTQILYDIVSIGDKCMEALPTQIQRVYPLAKEYMETSWQTSNNSSELDQHKLMLMEKALKIIDLYIEAHYEKKTISPKRS
jgi:hypothetical protein